MISGDRRINMPLAARQCGQHWAKGLRIADLVAVGAREDSALRSCVLAV